MTRIRSMNLLILTSLFVSLVLNCGGSNPYLKRVPSLTPIRLGAKASTPIAFTRLVIRVPSESVIGAHYSGLFLVRQYSHVWLSNIAIASDEFKIITSEHMSSLGYKVMGGDNLLFGDDKSSKAEYQLGGTILSMRYNTYNQASNKTAEAILGIEWQLYDVLSEQVVYTKTTNGYGHQSGFGIACIKEAYRAALDNLLADGQFVEVAQRSAQENWEQSVEYITPIELNYHPSSKNITLPNDLDSVFDAVLIIRAGSGVGSGVVISEDGWALSAAHTVSDLDKVVVELYSGLELLAEVIRVDRRQDVALIKLPV